MTFCEAVVVVAIVFCFVRVHYLEACSRAQDFLSFNSNGSFFHLVPILWLRTTGASSKNSYCNLYGFKYNRKLAVYSLLNEKNCCFFQFTFFALFENRKKNYNFL